jgi:hypothetical protein
MFVSTMMLQQLVQQLLQRRPLAAAPACAAQLRDGRPAGQPGQQQQQQQGKSR